MRVHALPLLLRLKHSQEHSPLNALSIAVSSSVHSWIMVRGGKNPFIIHPLETHTIVTQVEKEMVSL